MPKCVLHKIAFFKYYKLANWEFFNTNEILLKLRHISADYDPFITSFIIYCYISKRNFKECFQEHIFEMRKPTLLNFF